jgi:hypothetical protein
MTKLRVAVGKIESWFACEMLFAQNANAKQRSEVLPPLLFEKSVIANQRVQLLLSCITCYEF